MTLLQNKPRQSLAVVALVGNYQTDEANWLGALFSKLLGEHLQAAGLSVLNYNTAARQLVSNKISLPLDKNSLQRLHSALSATVILYGQYVLDIDSRMLGVRLDLAVDGSIPVPIEASTPLAAFPRFIERLSLAIFERLSGVVNDMVRQQVSGVPRPANFEAFRQMAMAQAAWHNGQKELALASITSALTLDPDYEEAAALEVAIARDAGDTTTVRAAFRRWANIAAKQRRSKESAERLVLLGNWLDERGEGAESLRAYEDALSVFKRINDEVGIARVQNNLANLELLHGKTQSAIKTYRRSLRAFESDPALQQDTIITLLNLSQAHKILGQQSEALSAIDRALSMARQRKDTHLEARCLAQRGAISDDMGKWSQANADYTRAGSLLDVLADEAGLAVVRSHQAILQRQQGNYTQAEGLLLQAAASLERHGTPHDQAMVWLNLADLYYAMALYDQSWNYAEQALRTFERLNSAWAEPARDLLETLSDLPQPEPEMEQDLYNDENLYNNEDEYNTGENGGDEDVNSGVGRTAMM